MKVVLCTCPPDRAEELARSALHAGAACVQVVPGVRSLYRWDGRVCDDTEALLLLKCDADRVESVRRQVRAVHPYELPEWVVLDVDPLTAPDYRDWVRRSARSAPVRGDE